MQKGYLLDPDRSRVLNPDKTDSISAPPFPFIPPETQPPLKVGWEHAVRTQLVQRVVGRFVFGERRHTQDVAYSERFEAGVGQHHVARPRVRERNENRQTSFCPVYTLRPDGGCSLHSAAGVVSTKTDIDHGKFKTSSLPCLVTTIMLGRRVAKSNARE